MNTKFLSVAWGSLFAVGLALGNPGPQDQFQAPNETQQQAQEHSRNGHMDPEKQLAFLTKKLNLTAEQQNQIRPILTERQQQMEALHADTSLSREERFSKMKASRQDSRAKIEALLNADQKPVFEQMRQRGGERNGAKDGDGNSK